MLVLILGGIWSAGCGGTGLVTTSGTLPGGPEGVVGDAPDMPDPAGWNGGVVEIINGAGLATIENYDESHNAMVLMANLSNQTVPAATLTISGTQNPSTSVVTGAMAPQRALGAASSAGRFDLAAWQQRKLEHLAAEGVNRNQVRPRVAPAVENFWVISDWNKDTYVQRDADLRGTGVNCYVYVDQNVTKAEFSDQQVLDLIALFDDDIYAQDRGVFGSEWKPGIDNDNRVFILVTNAWGGKDVSGYFSSEDEVPNTASDPHSNEHEIFYVDAGSTTADEAGALLGHEFQHMINYNQRFRIKGVTEDTWLNEGLSMFAEDVCGFGLVSGKSAASSGMAKSYLDDPSSVSLTVWGQKDANYGASMLFVRFIWEKYGQNALITKLMSGAHAGAQNCADGTGETFKKLFVRFAYMNYYSGWSPDPYYNYTTVNIYDGTYAGVKLTNANSIVPSSLPSTQTAAVLPYSARYYSIPNEDVEALELEFEDCDDMGIYEQWK